MQPRRGAETKLEIIFNQKIQREANLDFSVDGTIIAYSAVSDSIPEEDRIIFKDGASVDQELVQASNSQEWCVRVWYDASGSILIPVNVIERVRETLTSKFYT